MDSADRSGARRGRFRCGEDEQSGQRASTVLLSRSQRASRCVNGGPSFARKGRTGPSGPSGARSPRRVLAGSRKPASTGAAAPRTASRLPLPDTGGHADTVSAEYTREHECRCRPSRQQRRAYRHLRDQDGRGVTCAHVHGRQALLTAQRRSVAVATGMLAARQGRSSVIHKRGCRRPMVARSPAGRR